MSEVSNNDSDNSLDLSKFYDLDIQDEKAAFRVQNQDYFSEVEATIPKAKNAQTKLASIQVELKAKVLQLRKQIEERTKAAQNNQNQEAKAHLVVSEKTGQKNNSNQNVEGEEDLLKKDLAFCQQALVEGREIDSRMTKDISTLENILATGEKQSYKVIIDIALKPLPSDRAKEKDKDKNKDKNKGKDQNKDSKEQRKNNSAEKNAPKGKLTAEDMKKLRNGKALNAAPDKKGGALEKPVLHKINNNLIANTQKGYSNG